MAWDGSGGFDRIHNWVTDASGAIDITASRMDAEDDGFATGLENCVTRDGQNSPSADLPMGTYKHTGVGNAAALTSYASAGQVAKNALHYATLSSSGTDTYVGTLPISPGSYQAGGRYQFISNYANTGECSVNFNGIGAGNIKLPNGSDPYDNAILSGQIVDLIHSGGNFILLNPHTTAFTGEVTATVDEINALNANTKVHAVTSGTTLATASETQVVFGTETFDTKAEYDAATGLFTAADAGYYLVTASVAMTSEAQDDWVASNHIYALIKKGSTEIEKASIEVEATFGGELCITLSTVVLLAATNTISVHAYQDSGSTVDYTDGTAGQNSMTTLSITRLP